MALEDRLAFRGALLEHRTEDEWRLYRPQHQSVYHGTFPFEGREVTGAELIREYAQRFPADREYSDKGHLNRMLAECDIPQFTFTHPQILRGFLLSARTPTEWRRYQPSYHTFWDVDFKYMGIDIKGQMLLYNIFVELENQREGTFYAFIDYTLERNPEFYKKLQTTRNGAFIKNVFDIAGLTIKSKSIFEEDITPERLREILLARRTEEEWSKWQGKSTDFEQTWFDLEGYKNFTGAALRRHYIVGRDRKCSARDLFAEAGIKAGGDPELLQRIVEDRFEKLYGLLDNPQAVRELFLQVKSEEEWRKPQKLTDLRKERVSINDDRSITIHTLLHLFSAYKYNARQDSINDYVGFDAQRNPEKYERLFRSNKTELGELLNFAGLEAKFVPEITELDLHDTNLLRRLLFHTAHEEKELAPSEVKKLPAANFRKARLRDPTSGIDISGHTLMLFYSALSYLKEHPEAKVSLNDAATHFNFGKSNQAVMDEILAKTRF